VVANSILKPDNLTGVKLYLNNGNLNVKIYRVPKKEDEPITPLFIEGF
jgi:hypothetical protein